MKNYTKSLEKLKLQNSYNLTKDIQEKLFSNTLNLLYEHHVKKSKVYKNILLKKNTKKTDFLDLKKAPFLPTRIFKELDLKSIKDSEVFKVIKSSGTSGSQSKIYLDKHNSQNQIKILSKLFQDFFKITYRMPMIIIDKVNVIKDRKSFSARGAGILGFSVFGKDHFYALDDNNKLRTKELLKYLNKYSNKKILIFGLTNIIWESLLKFDNKKINLSNSFLIHGGGWKKLSDKNVNNEIFKKKLKKNFSIKNIHNYYGMVEQTGSIFFECEKGFFHTSIFSDILVKNKFFKDNDLKKKGIVQLISLLPTSYPGHNLITEDEGAIYGVDSCDCNRTGKTFKIYGRLKKSEIRGCSDSNDL